MSTSSSHLSFGHTADTRDKSRLAPPILAAVYPFLLSAYHWLLVDSGLGYAGRLGAFFSLILAFGVSAFALLFAVRLQEPQRPTSYELRTRRTAYLAVVAPTLYVFVSVGSGLLHSPLPDELTWVIIWALITLWANAGTDDIAEEQGKARLSPATRVIHGVAATVVVFFVLFHIGNHLFALVGPEAHTKVMKLGRQVYRAAAFEPVLVALMIFMVVTGLRLAWRWSAVSSDAFRVFQVASGVYLSMFILGHMNSVFIYARATQHIETGWTFATGTEAGLVYDAWNIRLLPHYALGVFFVLGHLASGLRVVLLGHNVNRAAADRVLKLGLAASAVTATAIMSGMCGLRLI